VDVRIVGFELPPRPWGDPRPGGVVCENIHVGVQRRSEVVDLVRSDALKAVWDLAIDVTAEDGGLDFRGPYVHGRRGERFLYLSWGTVDGVGTFEMFRRAKLMLGAVDADLVRAAAHPGGRLIGRLRLTGADGGPRCAAVRPPAIEWALNPS